MKSDQKKHKMPKLNAKKLYNINKKNTNYLATKIKIFY